MSTPTKARTRPDTLLAGRQHDDRAARSRPRRRGLLAFAALMIVGSALASAVLFARAGDTTEVLAISTGVPKGHTIGRDDLVTKDVAGIDGTYSVDDAASLVGSTALVDMVVGQVVMRGMTTEVPTPGAGRATVGLSLDPARAPSAGLQAGDVVDVIAVPGGENGGRNSDNLDAPPVLAADALVYDAAGSATQGGGVLVTVIVDEAVASRVAAYSTANRVAIVETAADAGGS